MCIILKSYDDLFRFALSRFGNKKGSRFICSMSILSYKHIFNNHEIKEIKNGPIECLIEIPYTSWVRSNDLDFGFSKILVNVLT